MQTQTSCTTVSCASGNDYTFTINLYINLWCFVLVPWHNKHRTTHRPGHLMRTRLPLYDSTELAAKATSWGRAQSAAGDLWKPSVGRGPPCKAQRNRG